MDFKRYEPENFNTLLGHPEGRFMLVADHLAVMEEKDLEWFNKYKERGEQIAARSQAIDKWERIYKEDTTALQAETVRQAEEIERYQEALEKIVSDKEYCDVEDGDPCSCKACQFSRIAQDALKTKTEVKG